MLSNCGTRTICPFRPMKKILSTILRERTDTIEYRAIRKALMNCAQNAKFEYRVLKIDPKTITMLQNNGIKVEKNQDNGYEVYLLTW